MIKGVILSALADLTLGGLWSCDACPCAGKAAAIAPKKALNASLNAMERLSARIVWMTMSPKPISLPSWPTAVRTRPSSNPKTEPTIDSSRSIVKRNRPTIQRAARSCSKPHPTRNSKIGKRKPGAIGEGPDRDLGQLSGGTGLLCLLPLLGLAEITGALLGALTVECFDQQ